MLEASTDNAVPSLRDVRPSAAIEGIGVAAGAMSRIREGLCSARRGSPAYSLEVREPGIAARGGEQPVRPGGVVSAMPARLSSADWRTRTPEPAWLCLRAVSLARRAGLAPPGFREGAHWAPRWLYHGFYTRPPTPGC